MKKEDLISVLITAVVGLLAGSYLYLTSFAEIINRVFMSDADDVTELTITGDMYGACSNVCPSFQVKRGGLYHFIYPATDNFEKIKKEGDLPFFLRIKLRNNLITEELEKQSREWEVSICDSETEKNEVIYRITLDGKFYILDSCKTKVDKDSKLWDTLQELWEYMQIDDK